MARSNSILAPQEHVPSVDWVMGPVLDVFADPAMFERVEVLPLVRPVNRNVCDCNTSWDPRRNARRRAFVARLGMVLGPGCW